MGPGCLPVVLTCNSARPPDVSEVLDSELRWRDPDGYAALHAQVAEHLQQRVLDTTGEEQRQAMLDVLRLYRLNPVTRRFFDWEQPGRS